MDSESRVVVQDDMRYSCHSSGVCCSTFSKIEVDVETEAEIRRFEDEGGSIPGVESAASGIADEPDTSKCSLGRPCRVLSSRPDGACVYLGPDLLCELHRKIGVQAKPRVCREFPFRFRKTPAGTYVGLSFVCPSVRAGKGRTLQEQRSELDAMCDAAFARSEVAEPIMLGSRICLKWDEYLEVEQGLFDLVRSSDESIPVRLIACNVLVHMLAMYHREVHGLPGVEEYGTFAEAEVRRFVDSMRASRYEGVFRVARKKGASPLVARMFMGMIVSFASSLLVNRNRVSVLAGILGQYARHALGFVGFRLHPVKRRVSHREIRSVLFPREGSSADLLVRYVEHCIFRKDLIYKSSLMRGLNLLLLNVALVRWYAAAEARTAGRVMPDDEDFSQAVMDVEKHYGYHSKFYENVVGQPVIDEIIESFLIRRNYPFIILSEGS